VIVSRAKREKDRHRYTGKERAYSVKPSITTGDRCRASLPGLDLLGMGLVAALEGFKPPASCL